MGYQCLPHEKSAWYIYKASEAPLRRLEAPSLRCSASDLALRLESSKASGKLACLAVVEGEGALAGRSAGTARLQVGHMAGLPSQLMHACSWQ